jgi:hypothetical protein
MSAISYYTAEGKEIERIRLFKKRNASKAWDIAAR